MTTSEQDHTSVLWKGNIGFAQSGDGEFARSGDGGFARLGDGGFARANSQLDICSQHCRSAVGKNCRSAAQAAECTQDYRSEMQIGLINIDILPSDTLPGILPDMVNQ